MIKNQISQQMSPEQLDTALQKIKALEGSLPFLVGLEPDDRQKLVKPGDRSQGFINRAYKLGLQIDGHLPRSFELSEMRKDVDLADKLSHLMIATSQFAEKLADTYAIANGEAYSAALLIYRTAKQVRGVQGLEQALEELGRRFARSNAGSTSETDAPSEPAPSENEVQ